MNGIRTVGIVGDLVRMIILLIASFAIFVVLIAIRVQLLRCGNKGNVGIKKRSACK